MSKEPSQLHNISATAAGEDIIHVEKLRNKSWKPECVGSFNMDWWIL
jgi:hypothetical protein